MRKVMQGVMWSVALLATLAMVSGCARLKPAPITATHSAVQPAHRNSTDWWNKRHQEKNARAKAGDVDLLFIGDSITHSWENSGKDVWTKYYGDRKAANIGFSGDRTQHVLWRLENGNIDNIYPKLAVIMIGTNNHRDNSADEIADGISEIIRKLREDRPKMKILLLGIFPRADVEPALCTKLLEVNKQIAKLDSIRKVTYLDISKAFLNDEGILTKEIMPDLLHPQAKGYSIWADEIETAVTKLLGE
jgi:lysophospholipase L1-like esterase